MDEKNIIVWSKDRLLAKSDFMAESNPSVFEDSHSHLGYHYTWTINSVNVDDQIFFYIENIQLYTRFHCLLSWIRDSEYSDSILLHEQRHFDLAEQLRREYLPKVCATFYENQYPTRGQNEEQRRQHAKEDSGIMIAQEIKKLEQILDKKRAEYDKATDFGNNLDALKIFNEQFTKLHQ